MHAKDRNSRFLAPLGMTTPAGIEEEANVK
jgi:hypothetical protein